MEYEVKHLEGKVADAKLEKTLLAGEKNQANDHEKELQLQTFEAEKKNLELERKVRLQKSTILNNSKEIA